MIDSGSGTELAAVASRIVHILPEPDARAEPVFAG